ncbi:hypothetical protein NKR19_g5407 [Coniochaeta hoffmannii]|uniref:Uncharacterized protein n=1 Tax=Coniochaeta hoffmannii TaxID=91930 RepID=A0AA38S675_9PEZI|nr:hypothetical protein NKR19_g5407 [Coniochaeta hoffmannii]
MNNNLGGTIDWMNAGKSTYPAYTHNGIDSRLPRAQCDVERRLLELMRLDAWLSKVGGTHEIRVGTADADARFVQEVMDSFEPHFMDAEISNVDGGAQFNTELGQTLVEYLEDQKLTRAEALYALVAVLRAVKVGQCVLSGPDTGMLAEIMEKDVQVCLVERFSIGFIERKQSYTCRKFRTPRYVTCRDSVGPVDTY